MKNLGIDSLKSFVSFLIALAITLDDVLRDKKVKPFEILDIFRVLMKYKDVYSKVKPAAEELKDLDKEEEAEITAYIEEEFDLPNDRLEVIVKAAVKTGLQIFLLIKLIKNEEMGEEELKEAV